MAGNRIAFALWLLVWLAAWTAGQGNMALCLLVGSGAAAVVELLLSRLTAGRITAALTAGVSCRKGEALTVTVTAENTGFLSCPGAAAVLCCRNLLTGETEMVTVRFSVAGKGKTTVSHVFHPSRCGKLELTLETIRVFDLFGLAGVKRPVSLQTSSLVLPELYPVELLVTERQQRDMDSDEYSMYRPGDDPSETFALREYVPGDRVRNIHWKLTEKTGSVTVRQLGLPVNNSLLVVLDSTAAADASPALREALGEMAVSVSAALCQQGVGHRIAWLPPQRETAELCGVASLEELTGSMAQVLAARTTAPGAAVPERLAGERGLDYAHIVVVTSQPGEETVTAEGGLVSYLAVTEATTERKEGVYLAV